MTRLTLLLRGGIDVAVQELWMRTARKESIDEVLDRVEWLPDQEFRRFEYGLVAYYRRNESEQERIATALFRRCSGSRNPRSRHRINEILAMLEHVHDPMIR